MGIFMVNSLCCFRMQLFVTRLTVHFLVILMLVGTGYLIFLAAGNAHIHHNEIQLRSLVEARSFGKNIIALLVQFQVYLKVCIHFFVLVYYYHVLVANCDSSSKQLTTNTVSGTGLL